MKAKIKPRINLKDRTPLETIIPLSTPMILFVDPASICNFKCKFCPTGNPELINNTGRWQGLMDFDLYRKIIDGLRDFDEPLKVLRLYKEGEPFLNRQLADMVDYAKKSGVVSYIDTTTNGSRLQPEQIKPILDAGLDRINISVDGMSDEQFLDFTGVKVDFNQYVDNIAHLYGIKGDCEICIKTAGDFMSREDRDCFYAVFGDYADRIFIENIAPCWPEFGVEDRLGVTISKGIYNQPIDEVATCPYIFYSIAVNADGTVSLCFLDWAHKLLLGDLRAQSLKDIWQGEKLYRHQLAHLRGQRQEHPVCAQCGQLSHGLPDNIDPYVDILARRLLAARQSRAR
jgi:MoaA/NifB/PqqE/SkfB family radical SAM enzyme